MMGAMMGVMVLCGGAAVDIGRWLHAKSVTASALDAAVLAGGRMLQLNPDDEDAALLAAQQYYLHNVSTRIQLETNSVTFAIAGDKKSLSASGTASIKTTLLNVAGIEELPVLGAPGSVFPKAELTSGGGGGGSNLEIALVLDVTSSMCSDSLNPCSNHPKIAGLKAAAKDLIEIVVPENQTTRTSKVAVVPFSTRIRVAADNGNGAMMKLLTNLDDRWSGHYKSYYNCSGSSGGGENAGTRTCADFTVEQADNWKILPCVTDRFYDAAGYDYTDDAPGPGRWLNAHDGTRRTQSADSSSIALPVGQGTGTAADPADYWNYDANPYCGDVSESNEILPLTANKPQLRNKIDAIEAFGSTSGALGTAFGWYTLSPNWSSIWTGTSAPAPYSDLTATNASGAPVLRKVAVIMSDGVYNTVRGWKGRGSAGCRQSCQGAVHADEGTGHRDLYGRPGAERAEPGRPRDRRGHTALVRIEPATFLRYADRREPAPGVPRHRNLHDRSVPVALTRRPSMSGKCRSMAPPVARSRRLCFI